MKTGHLVQTWFDTGARGATILYGVVTASGPKTFSVRWESGLSNRVRHGHGTVERARDVGEAAIAMARSGHGLGSR
jgi:hypothetical protein